MFNGAYFQRSVHKISTLVVKNSMLGKVKELFCQMLGGNGYGEMPPKITSSENLLMALSQQHKASCFCSASSPAARV